MRCGRSRDDLVRVTSIGIESGKTAATKRRWTPRTLRSSGIEATAWPITRGNVQRALGNFAPWRKRKTHRFSGKISAAVVSRRLDAVRKRLLKVHGLKL